MFDILPLNAVPREIPLPVDLTNSRDVCLKIIKCCPKSHERDSAIQALKRMSKPSLKRKILHRAAILKECLHPEFDEIEIVIDIAVKCRNYFVHGPNDDFNFTVIEPFQSFLTNTLEFIFATSDLIEAGWDASAWHKRSFMPSGHSFARFIDEYHYALPELKRLLKPTL